MSNGCDENLLNVSLDVIGGGHGKWDLRVSIRPLVRGIRLSGATVTLFDVDGECLGATVVVPCDGLLETPVVHEVSVGCEDSADPRSVRAWCEVHLEGGAAPVMLERSLRSPSSFSDFVSGDLVLKRGCIPKGVPLERDELARLQSGLAEVAPKGRSAMASALQPVEPFRSPPDGSQAFDAFSQDFMDAFGLDAEDELTEELLKLIQES